MKERLKEILQNHDYYAHCEGCTRVIKACENCRDERLADHLLANGVIVPPCKVGDKVYEVQECPSRIQALKVENIHFDGHHFSFGWCLWDARGFYRNIHGFTDSDIGKTVFLTRAEAEKALAERVNHD